MFHVEHDLRASLASYAQLILASPHDLVSPRAAAELTTRHIPEGLALARLLPSGPARLIDVGSGSGLPGVVVALARPDLRVTLVEATGKKARFLEDVCARLTPSTHVLNVRAEDLPVHERDADLVTARAVAPLVRLIPLTMGLLRPGGRLYAVKGERWRAELDAARTVLRGHRLVATPADPEGSDPGVEPPLRVVIIERGARSAAAATEGAR